MLPRFLSFEPKSEAQCVIILEATPLKPEKLTKFKCHYTKIMMVFGAIGARAE
jgi:hypothetical protein